jgi:hypothetical protein
VLRELGGQQLNKNAVIVKFALYGDVDLNGSVDADDYFQIDRNARAGSKGYSGGDVDYSGSVDADDLFLVDQTFASGASIADAGITKLLALAQSDLIVR